MSFTEAIRSVYRNYARFDGRAPRSEYWWFWLFNVLVIVVIYVIGALLAVAFRNSTSSQPMTGIYVFVGLALLVYLVLNFIPSLAVSARRLHDSDKSGWWLLIAFVPYIGAIVLLIFMVLPSTRGHNRFGPPYGHPAGDQRAQYWGPSRSDALRKFADDAQKAAASGYEPVWQEWRVYGGNEVLEVVYGQRPPDAVWNAPTAPWSTPPGTERMTSDPYTRQPPEA